MACQLTFGLPAVTSNTSYLSCDQGLRRRGAAGVAQACMANNMVKTDHHSILWMRRNASRNEIKSVYRNPDVCKKRGNAQRFKQINRGYQVNMALRKEPRSSRTQPGWRLATVDEAKGKLELIKQSNMLEKWDRARLLDGWIGGSAYDFHIQVGFRSCLGYMLVIQSPTFETSNADDRNVIPYSEITGRSKEGRRAALFLCCEDWNVEVLYWLMGGKTEEGRARENGIWESEETRKAGKLISALARELQSVRAERIEPRLEFSRDSLDVLSIDIRKSLKALQEKTKSVVTLQIDLEKYRIRNIEEIGSDILSEMREMRLLEDLIEGFGLDTSVSSTWEAIAHTIWYFTVDTAAALYFQSLCRIFHPVSEMKSALYISLILSAFKMFRRFSFSDVERAAAKDAKGDWKRFVEILRDQGFRLIRCEGSCDVLSSLLCQATMDGDVDLVQCLIQSDADPSETDGGGKAAMHYAARVKDKSKGLEIAKMLLEADENLANTLDSEKQTPLHAAAIADHVEMYQLLRRHHAKLDSKDKKGRLPLHYAVCCKQEYKSFIRDLIVGQLYLVDEKDNDGEKTPLDFAIQNNADPEFVLFLLAVSDKRRSYFKKLPYPLQFYLHGSLRLGFGRFVRNLVREGADPVEPENEGKTAQQRTAESHILSLDAFLRLSFGALVCDLVRAGADPFEPDNEGKTALQRIAESHILFVDGVMRLGSGPLVRDLVPEGADLFEPDNEGKTSIGESDILFEHEYSVHALLREITDKNKEKASAGDKYGRNVLHVAAFLGRKDLCRLLLDIDRKMIDTKDREGQSAIFYAVAGRHNDPTVLELFNSRGGRDQVFVNDFSRATPLHMAATEGNLKMVEKLLSLISESPYDYIAAADVLGQTALHRAARGGHLDVVEMLLNSGAHPLKQRDCNGKTALHFAAEADGQNAVKIAELLLSKCESDEDKSLLLFASAVGIALPNPSLEKYLARERRQIRKTLKQENLVRVAARVGNIDMTREFITRGANIALILNKKWIDSLQTDKQKENVTKVLDQIKTIVEQGTDKPALEDNLGRSPFANGLAALFLNPFVRSPITVGISGEWGMGKSSVMAQTEIILLKTAAQFAFRSQLSVIGKRKRREIANGLNFIDNNLDSTRQVMNFIAKVANPHIFSKVFSSLSKLMSTLQALWEESAPFLSKFNECLDKKYESKDYHILKFMAIIDKRDMFEVDEESGSRNQIVAEMSLEEYSLQGTKPSILTIKYNAWHYRNETEAWAGLAVKIIEELEATMTVALKLRTRWMYNWRNNRNSICLKVIIPFFLAVVVAIFWSIIEATRKIKYGGPLGALIVAAWGLGNLVMSFVKPISSQVVDYICLPDHSQKLGYHQKVIDDINFLKEQLHYKRFWMWEVLAFIWCCITWSWNENYVPGTKIPKMPPAFSDDLKIIVFVDDLDRCDENVILQILSAVNLVLATCQINVILSMENKMIQKAIIRKYGSSNSKANNKFNEDIAVKYLKKIIQLPLHLPDPSDEESRDFLQSQLGKWASRKESTDEKRKTYGHRKANPKFQIGTSSPEKPKQGREETKKGLEESSGDVPKRAPNISGDLEQREDSLPLIIRGMVIPNYTQGEIDAFESLHAQCTGSRKLPRELKCLLAYHRLAWNILSLNPNVDLVDGWQVQLIAWIFVCWQWRHLITTLIKNWNKLKVLRNWKGIEENTIGPSLRDIVEDYIVERWPADQKSATKKEDATTDSLSNILPEENEEKTGDIMPEENVTTEGDDYLRKVPRKSLKENVEMREAKEREEWNKLRETLGVYNVSMDGIQAFQKFRFYCKPGYLPWPLSK